MPRPTALAIVASVILAFAATATAACRSDPVAPAAPTPGAVDLAPTVPPTTAPTLTFLAGDRRVAQGACTELEWSSEGVLRVYLDGRGVDASGRMEVCPTAPTTYTLTAALPDGGELERQVTVAVVAATPLPTDTAAPQPTVPPATAVPATETPTAAPTEGANVEFYPDNNVYELPKDQLCTAINWRTTGVTEVQLEREGMGRVPVGAAGREEACFEGRVRYTLYFKGPDGSEQRRELELRHRN